MASDKSLFADEHPTKEEWIEVYITHKIKQFTDLYADRIGVRVAIIPKKQEIVITLILANEQEEMSQPAKKIYCDEVEKIVKSVLVDEIDKSISHAAQASRVDSEIGRPSPMTGLNNEPSQLQRGKSFHKKMQADWLDTAEGQILIEKAVTKPTGRKGRIDIFVDDDDSNNLVAFAEVKDSDWDKMTDSAVRRNVRRQIRQVWNYIESQLKTKKDVSPGIIFPKQPKDKERMKLIESMFEEDGIPVVWQDETIEERKARS